MAESRRDFILGVQLEVDNAREMDDLMAALEAVRDSAGKPLVHEIEFRERGLQQIVERFEQIRRSGRLETGISQDFSRELGQLAAGMTTLRTRAMGVNPALNQLAEVIQRILTITSGAGQSLGTALGAPLGEGSKVVTQLNQQVREADDRLGALTERIQDLIAVRDAFLSGDLGAAEVLDELHSALRPEDLEKLEQGILGSRGNAAAIFEEIIQKLQTEQAGVRELAEQYRTKLAAALAAVSEQEQRLGREITGVTAEIEKQDTAIRSLAQDESRLGQAADQATARLQKEAVAVRELANELTRASRAAEVTTSKSTALTRWSPSSALTRTALHGELIEEVVKREVGNALLHIPEAEFTILGDRVPNLGRKLPGFRPAGLLPPAVFAMPSRTPDRSEGSPVHTLRTAVEEGVRAGIIGLSTSMPVEAGTIYHIPRFTKRASPMTSALSEPLPVWARVGPIAGMLGTTPIAGLLPPPQGSTATSGFTVNRFVDVVADRLRSMTGARFGATGDLRIMNDRNIAAMEAIAPGTTIVGIRQLTEAQTVLARAAAEASIAIDRQAQATRRQQQAAVASAQAARAARGGSGDGGGGGGGGRGRRKDDGDDSGKPKRYSEMTFYEQLLFRIRGLSAFAPAAFLTFGTVSLLREATSEAIKFQQAMADIQAVLPSRNMNERLRIEDDVIESARRYAVALLDAAEAAKFFAQAGFDPKRLTAAMDTALMAVAGAGLDPTQAQELILALDAMTQGSLDALSVLDRVSRVEASRAVTAQDLVAAITRVGPIAHQLRADMIGISDEFDTVMAATTGIVERTRMTGMQAATALRFISARLGSPEITRNLQEIGGVRLGRTPEQLRPINEILFEIAKAHERLTQAGRTAEATQLLVALGGARQLSATTALIQSYQEEAINAGDSIMDLERESSLAFGDMQDRARTSLNTIRAELSRTRVSFTELGNEIIKNPLVNFTILTSLKSVQTALLGLSVPFRAITKLFEGVRIALGDSRFGVDFLNREEILNAPQVKDFQQFASSFGASSSDLLAAVTASSEGIAAAIRDQLGGRTLEEIIDAFDRGTLAARNLREEMGEKLAQDLENLNPRLAELRREIENTTNVEARQSLQAERIALAYEMLSKSAYMAGGVLAANNQRIKDSFEALTNEVERVFSKGLSDRIQIAARGYTKALQPLFETDVSNIDQANRVLNEFLKNVPKDLAPVFDAFFRQGDAVRQWRLAVEEGGGAVEDFGAILDRYAERVTKATDATTGLGPALREGLIRSLELMDQEDGVLGALNLDTPGFKAMETFLQSLRREAEKLLEERGGTGADSRLVQLIELLSHPQAAPAVMLQTVAQGFTRISDELTRLILEYYRAESAADAFAESYQRVGLSFDETSARFENASNLLRGVLTFHSNTISRIIELSSELDKMRMNVFQTFSEGHTMDIGEGYLALEASANVQQVLANDRMRNTQLILAKQIEFAREQLRAFESDGVFMSEILGTDTEALEVFNTINRSLELLSDNISDTAALQEFLLSWDQLRDKVEAVTRARALAKAEVDREKQDYEQMVALEEIRGRAFADLVALRGSIADRADAELQSELAILEIKRDQLRNDETLGEIELDTRLRELDLAERKLRVENRIYTIIEAYTELTRQSQQNVKDSLSGIQSLFTDTSGFLRADRSERFSRLFSPAASMVLTRTSENLFEELFNVESNTLFGRIARQIGETPEARMRKELQRTFERGGMDIAQRFETAGEAVAAMLEQAMYRGTGSPTTATTAGTVDLGISGGASSESASAAIQRLTRSQRVAAALRRSQIDEQLALLLGSFAATSVFGGGPNANTGAGVGGMFGRAFGDWAGEKIGSALGSALLPGLGTIVGTFAGGFLGSLFDDDDNDREQLATLQRIDQNTRETADVLLLENRLLDVMRGAFNVPSRFVVPQYVPMGPSTASTTGSQTQNAPPAGVTISNISITVNGGSNGDEIAEQIRQQIGPVLQDAFYRIGIVS